MLATRAAQTDSAALRRLLLAAKAPKSTFLSGWNVYTHLLSSWFTRTYASPALSFLFAGAVKMPRACWLLAALQLLCAELPRSSGTADDMLPPRSSSIAVDAPVWSAGGWSAIAVHANDSMTVTAGGAHFARSAGDIRLHADGRWHSRSDGTLKKVGAGVHVSGTHARLGAWTGWQTTWSCAATTMITTIKHFSGEEDTFVFEQRFPGGAENTSLAHPDHKFRIDQALSQWPVFDGGSLTWKAQGWSGTMSCGTTIADSVMQLDGKYLSLQGGPVLSFDEPDGFIENCTGAIFSTFDHFKSGIWANTGPAPASSGSGSGSSLSPEQCQVHKGVNYERHDPFGADYSSAGLKLYNTTKYLSGAECCASCCGYSNCSAWTICNGCPAPYTDICFLKASTVGTHKDGKAISGTCAWYTPDPPGPLAPGQLVAGVHGGIAVLHRCRKHTCTPQSPPQLDLQGQL